MSATAFVINPGSRDGHVVAVFTIGVAGTDAIVKTVDHWTLLDGKIISLWARIFRAAGRARETRDQARPRSLILLSLVWAGAERIPRCLRSASDVAKEPVCHCR